MHLNDKHEPLYRLKCCQCGHDTLLFVQSPFDYVKRGHAPCLAGGAVCHNREKHYEIYDWKNNRLVMIIKLCAGRLTQTSLP